MKTHKTYLVAKAGTAGNQTTNIECPAGYRMGIIAARMQTNNAANVTCTLGTYDVNDANMLTYNSQSISSSETTAAPKPLESSAKGDSRLAGTEVVLEPGEYFQFTNSACAADKLMYLALNYWLEPLRSLYIPAT